MALFMQEKKARIVEGFLNAVNCGSGFNEFTLSSIAAECGVTGGELELLLPYGMPEVAKELWQKHLEELKPLIKLENGVTKSVEAAILTSFELLKPYKRAVRKAFKFGLIPSNLPFSIKFFWQMADVIWKELGVNDSTFAYYTKRGILSGIYSSCFLYFILSSKALKLEDLLKKELTLLHKVMKYAPKF